MIIYVCECYMREILQLPFTEPLRFQMAGVQLG